MTLHVAQLGFHVDAQAREPAQLLRDWPTMVDLADAATRAGVRVTVVQACARAESLHHNGVAYRFFAADSAQRTVALSKGFESLIRNLRADVFHVHGLCFPNDVRQLARLVPDVPILLQDHASRPPRFWRWRKRRAWRQGFAAAGSIAFCSLAQSEPFAAAGLIGPRTQIWQIPESSSRFSSACQLAARAACPLAGDPCVLWVGQLIDRKDPLTVLSGVSLASQALPGLQLWCCFQTDTLLQRVRARIEHDPALRGRVHLLGRVEHERIETLMRAADLFVAASRFEGSGYALLEALACGLAPVVTDIPSFRALTANGQIGRLWPCGDAQGLAGALVQVASQPRTPLRLSVRAHFERHLSLDALGRTLLQAYQRLSEHPGSASAAIDAPQAAP